MFRRVIPLLCYSVSQFSRVGIFPLHLDPPTAQHRELFRLLVGDRHCRQGNDGGKCCVHAADIVPIAGGGSGGCCGGNKNGGYQRSNYPSDSLWCLEPFAESLKNSDRVPFDDLILVPNTRFPVALRLSTHLAALTTLVTRGLPRVHVDFTALEHPDEDMPCVYELTQKYKNSTLVHWLQDAHEMQKWAHFSDVKHHVPMLLLQTVSFPVSMVGKPPDPRFIEKVMRSSSGVLSMTDKAPETQQQQQQQQQLLHLQRPQQDKTDYVSISTHGSYAGSPDDNATNGCIIDISAGAYHNPSRVVKGHGEEQVEISRSYMSSSTASWLASSSDKVSTLLHSSDDGSFIKDGHNDHEKNENEHLLTVNGNNNNSGNSSNDKRYIHSDHKDPGKVNRGGVGEHDMTSGGGGGNGSSSSSGGNVISQSNHAVQNDDQSLPLEGIEQEEGEEDEKNRREEEDMDTITSSDILPTSRKVRHLVEELFYTHHGVETPHNNSLRNFPPPHVEVHTVHRCTGADVRQALWEREVDPTLLLTEPVYRYVTSHGLYHDYRKDTYPKLAHMLYDGGGGAGSSDSRNSRTGAWRKTKIHSLGATAMLSFPGLIPRLELHYDKNNLLAREYYEKLSHYEVAPDEEPDLIVPIGGDGYMMHCIRHNWSRFIPFFGVNAGHVGYLLNDPSTLSELFSAPLKLHTTIMLYCLAEKETETGEKVLLSELAFNDAWVERSSGQTALIRILVNGDERIRQLRGDGVLVATAAGSTAYCRALGASPVPVGAPLIQVVGSNVVSPAQWRPTHLNQEDQVELEVIDSFKRPCRCFVDSVDVGNVTRMLVRSSRAAGVAIAFASSCDLQQKLYQVQFPKNP